MSVVPAYQMNNLTFKYDNEHDVLHLFIGESKVSYADELEPGVFVRFSDDDDSLTGVIIMGYQRRDKNALQKCLPININFNNIDQIIH
jgi:hypothetical protein